MKAAPSICFSDNRCITRMQFLPPVSGIITVTLFQKELSNKVGTSVFDGLLGNDQLIVILQRLNQRDASSTGFFDEQHCSCEAYLSQRPCLRR